MMAKATSAKPTDFLLRPTHPDKAGLNKMQDAENTELSDATKQYFVFTEKFQHFVYA